MEYELKIAMEVKAQVKKIARAANCCDAAVISFLVEEFTTLIGSDKSLFKDIVEKICVREC